MDYLIKNGYDSRVKAISIGANRRRGRPSKTKGALEYQDSDQDILSGVSDIESEPQYVKAKSKCRKKKSIAKDSDLSEESDYDIFYGDQVKKTILKSKKLGTITTPATSAQTKYFLLSL